MRLSDAYEVATMTACEVRVSPNHAGETDEWFMLSLNLAV